ncbi:Mov34/MPN/PAD-1 family protein [Metabacillus halosaccharovorans]|uniref:Mov34/MPN/PAD-1 family protein n=1 Tax=Metabacillus halosaccharovorans TaxID=930124 RepID=A0ABT3DFZ2_9BACI|nr:Mov34/MPN/PAD-1 family protein [Metabacillus halosaccharovorans]MCV9885441.1 Mov34/MPN/PAD-1 family protein [Metabacillus halosaccharovorans]
MENDSLIFSVYCYDELLNDGRSKLPYEACGILSGKNNQIHSIWKLKNEVKSDRRFFVGKKAVEETLLQIALKDEKVLAIYHTHPTTAPVPSYTDIKNHRESEVKMIIVSYKTKNPIVKCYCVQNRVYKEWPFLIKPIV